MSYILVQLAYQPVFHCFYYRLSRSIVFYFDANKKLISSKEGGVSAMMTWRKVRGKLKMNDEDMVDIVLGKKKD